MPTVRNLVNEAPPATATAAPVTAPAPDAAPVVAKVSPTPIPGALSVPLPSFLAALPQIAPDMVTGGSGVGNYIAVYEQNSYAAPQLKAAGVALGSLYLSAEGTYHGLPNMGFWMPTAVGFRTRVDDRMNLLAVKAGAVLEPGEEKEGFDPHYLCVALVDLGTRIIPAKLEVRGTKERIAAGAIRAVQQASTPEFAGLGEAHRVAAAYPIPWARVYHRGQTSARTGKSSGRQYFLGTSTSLPSTLDQLERLSAALQDPQFTADLSTVVESFTERHNKLKAGVR